MHIFKVMHIDELHDQTKSDEFIFLLNTTMYRL